MFPQPALEVMCGKISVLKIYYKYPIIELLNQWLPVFVMEAHKARWWKVSCISY